MLAHWDGGRRYANLRKLMRLARSYEELRGPDIEGFVRFIRDQETLGASQLEAVSEEEGADAVRLLTIHAAKGLEFKVVVVADAGRDTTGAPSADEILVRPDGRFGFHVVDPGSGRKRGVFSYEEVRAAEKADDEAERLRLYYVAMTRAIDRLIVSGAFDAERARDATRRSAGCSSGSASPTTCSPGSSSTAQRASSSRSTGTARNTWPSRSRPCSSTASLPCSPSCPSDPRRAATACRSSRRCRCRRSTACAGSRTRRSHCSSAARTATTRSGSPGCASSGRSAGR